MKCVKIVASGVLVISSMVLAVGCGGKRMPGNLSELEPHPSAQASQPSIRYASDMAESKKGRILMDFEALKGLWIDESVSSELRTKMGISDSTPNSLVRWLEERVQFVVSKDFNSRTAARYSSLSNSGVPHGLEVTTVMSNMGAAIYMTGKERHATSVTVDIPGFGTVPVNSPRVGLIMEGDGFFMDLIGEGKMDDVPHTLSRLGTLFHEARHSDGNATSLAFAHIECPDWHDYAGSYACDNNGNGPYTIGALFIKGVTETCKNCRPRTKELLRLLYTDSFSRILNKNAIWASEPEGVR